MTVGGRPLRFASGVLFLEDIDEGHIATRCFLFSLFRPPDGSVEPVSRRRAEPCPNESSPIPPTCGKRIALLCAKTECPSDERDHDGEDDHLAEKTRDARVKDDIDEQQRDPDGKEAQQDGILF